MKPNLVSTVIPVYNEEQAIGDDLDLIIEPMGVTNYDNESFVVLGFRQVLGPAQGGRRLHVAVQHYPCRFLNGENASSHNVQARRTALRK